MTPFGAHLPVLLVAVPLAAAALAALLGRGRLPWLVATAVAWFTLAAVVLLAEQVAAHGVVTYDLGAWPPPIGIEYRIDALNLLVLLLVTASAAVIVPASYANVADEIEPHNRGLFYAVLLVMYAGLLGVAATGDAFNAFVFIEIQSIASYALVALGAKRDRRALSAAFTYLVMGSIGATFFVIGVGLAYMMTGTLNMMDLAARLPDIAANRTVAVSFAFIIVGLGLKIAMFPLHLWLPNAYTYAPSPVATLLAATSTKVAAYLLLRFLFTVYGLDIGFETVVLTWVVMPLAIAGMVVGSLIAIGQDDVKRLLAYSSIAQIGYILLGMSLATHEGIQAAALHIFNHGLMKGALFLALSAVSLAVGQPTLARIAGLGRLMPWTFAAFVAGGLSLIGVPLTAGFISKWYLVVAALHGGLWWLALIIVATSLLAVVYVWRVVETAYARPAPAGVSVRAMPVLLTATWLLIAANIYFGIEPSLPVTFAGQAAATLLPSAP